MRSISSVSRPIMKGCYFILLLVASIFLIGCVPHFPQLDSYYISPFKLTQRENLMRAFLALSPNGKSMVVSWSGGLDLADLQTGKRIAVGDKTLWDLESANDDILTEIATWSFDGRYLGIQAKHYERSRDPVGYAFYILNMQNNSVKRYADLWATQFSPFNSYQVTSDKGIYNLKDGTIILYPVDFDFGQETEFGATNYGRLWSRKLGVPVAELGGLPHSDKGVLEMALQSLNMANPADPKFSYPIGVAVKHPNQLAKILLDPTGEFILSIEWQCSESQTLCSTNPLFPNNIHDTVLTVTRWRTKEQKELIRLSKIDPEHVVAKGYMAWSADGSTIYVSRLDAGPIVLKVK